jgi:acyl-CoA thioesterase-1
MEDNVILIIGDSLGLPRENVPYKKTWPYLLNKVLSTSHVVIKVQRALTSKMINEGVKADWLEFYRPKIVIIQVGIVDCAPRYLKNDSFLLKIINIQPSFIKKNVWKLIKNTKIRSPKNVDVSIIEFEKNINSYLTRCKSIGVEKVCLIKIAKCGKKMQIQNPKIIDQISSYNEVLNIVKDEYDFVETVNVLADADESYFIEDGYHLNEFGNSVLFKSIIEKIK